MTVYSLSEIRERDIFIIRGVFELPSSAMKEIPDVQWEELGTCWRAEGPEDDYVFYVIEPHDLR